MAAPTHPRTETDRQKVSIEIPAVLHRHLGFIGAVLNNVYWYLSKSEHSSYKRDRRDIARKLEDFVGQVHGKVEKPVKLSDYDGLQVKDGTKGEEDYNNNKTRPFLIDNEDRCGVWKKAVKEMCVQLRMSKSSKKKLEKQCISIFAEDILYIISQVDKAYRQPLHPSGDKNNPQSIPGKNEAPTIEKAQTASVVVHNAKKQDQESSVAGMSKEPEQHITTVPVGHNEEREKVISQSQLHDHRSQKHPTQMQQAEHQRAMKTVGDPTSQARNRTEEGENRAHAQVAKSQKQQTQNQRVEHQRMMKTVADPTSQASNRTEEGENRAHSQIAKSDSVKEKKQSKKGKNRTEDANNKGPTEQLPNDFVKQRKVQGEQIQRLPEQIPNYHEQQRTAKEEQSQRSIEQLKNEFDKKWKAREEETKSLIAQLRSELEQQKTNSEDLMQRVNNEKKLQEKIDELKNELDRVMEDSQSKEKERQRKTEEISRVTIKQTRKSKKGRIDEDENKYQRMQEEINSLQQQKAESLETQQRMQKEINSLQHQKAQSLETQQRLMDDINRLGRLLQQQKQISEDLRQRLSKEMGDKVSANESSVENISIKNRPMNIRDDYGTLQSNEWLDAKNYLDDEFNSYPEEKKVDIMCDIMKIISEEVTCAWDTLNSTFQGELLQPVKYAAQLMQNTDASVRQTEKHSRNIKIDKKRSSSLPRKKMISPAVTNAIGDFFRQWSDGFDYETLVKITTNEIQKKTELRCLSEEVFKDYIAATVKICWMMAIQRPPMTFDFSEKWYGETHQELFWGSVEDKDADVHVVFPILWHGKSVMGKGKVLRSLKKQSTYV